MPTAAGGVVVPAQPNSAPAGTIIKAKAFSTYTAVPQNNPVVRSFNLRNNELFTLQISDWRISA
jgi:hypothetical protein